MASLGHCLHDEAIVVLPWKPGGAFVRALKDCRRRITTGISRKRLASQLPIVKITFDIVRGVDMKRCGDETERMTCVVCRRFVCTRVRP